MLIEILLNSLLAICAFHYVIRYGRRGKIVDKIPGPPAIPILGNLLSFLKPVDQLWSVLRKMNNDYYPIYRIWSLTFAVVNIRHPDDVEALLSSMQTIEKSLIYDFLHPWFGTGLLTSTGAKWQHRRRILTPAFHFKVLEKYLEIMIELNEKTINALKNENNQVYDLQQIITEHTLNVISEAAMGIQLKEKEDRYKKYRSAVHDMGNVFLYRLVRPWLKSDKIFNMTTQGIKQKKALQVLHGFTTEIINERKEYHEKTMGKYLLNIESDVINTDDPKKEDIVEIPKRRLAMLDLLIASYRDGRNIDDIGIREEVDTFMFEGHDTSAMALVFILLLLAEHKDVQVRARDEVTEILNKSNGQIGMAEIQKFNYLERCIKESIRLYPSVSLISRKINKDVQLKKYLLPQGIIAHIHIFDIHRDSNYWPEPEKFDPDRFLTERMQGRHPYSYIPFSAGPRNCIGQKFAMMELKSFVASLLYHFYLESIDLAHEVPIIPDLVLRPARPVYIKLKPIITAI